MPFARLSPPGLLLLAVACAGLGWKGGPSGCQSREPGTGQRSQETIDRFERRDADLERLKPGSSELGAQASAVAATAGASTNAS